ncbi:plasmid mobilization protein [Peptoniphilaceae bacterium SGI.131]
MKKENRFRDKSIFFRCSEDEYKLIKHNQKLSGYKILNDFIIKCCVDQKIIIIDKEFLREQNINLTQIGNNINQIAKKVNTYNNIYNEELEKLKSYVENIIDIFVQLYNFM